MKEVLARLKEEWDNAEYVEDFDEGHIEDLFKVATHYENHIDWMLTKPSKIKKEEILKMKNDIQNILLKSGTSCLCGRSEWCSGCSPSSQENITFKEVMEYFDRLSEQKSV